MLISRRELAWTVPWALVSTNNSNTGTTTGVIRRQIDTPILTVSDWICRWTPQEFRVAIQSSGRFLYRGADNDGNDNDTKPLSLANILQEPLPDLLFPETYNNDAAALAYFQCLEEKLLANSQSWRTFNNNPSRRIKALPSTGHIATSDPQEAGKWGPVVSVWPIGTEWSYVWPRDRPTFYELEKSTCVEDALVVNTNLLGALQQPREVLFATGGAKHTRIGNIARDIAPSAFFVIPQRYDQSIQERLEMLNYGLS